MTIQLEVWQLVGAAFTIIGFVATLIKYALGQAQAVFNERRQSVTHTTQQLNTLIAKLEEDLQALEREFLLFKAELPNGYIRREDYIRNQTVIDSKLDAIASKIEQIYLRGLPNVRS